jgi:hypothetical protein
MPEYIREAMQRIDDGFNEVSVKIAASQHKLHLRNDSFSV